MRCWGMRGCQPVERTCAEAGKELGRLARDHLHPTPEALTRAVADAPHGMLPLVLAVTHMWSPTRATQETLLRELGRQPPTQRASLLLRRGWARYRPVLAPACRGPRSRRWRRP